MQGQNLQYRDKPTLRSILAFMDYYNYDAKDFSISFRPEIQRFPLKFLMEKFTSEVLKKCEFSQTRNV